LKPYYEHAGITIYHGDCREVWSELPRFAFDVVTDPPYGIGLENHAAGRERRLESYAISGDQSPETAYFIVEECDRSEWPLITFASPWLPLQGEWRNLLVWNKGGAVGGGGDTSLCLKRTWELIQTARTTLNGSRDGSVLYYPITPADTEIHVARKPTELMAYLIAKLTTPAAVILDPCCGSGATLEAAKKQGRLAIGIEIEEKYCEIAAKRLSQEVFDFSEAK
jgi:site-specific DNA-methyltransferase (adenine-specific)